MMRLSLLLLFIISTTSNADDNKAITVVELFTSQGCHSCPPADTLLAQVDKQSNTITLSCHVTYWNYLGWEDTFAKAFCDNRQRNYQSTLKGNRGVYTPQIIINGRFATVGSRKQNVKQAIEIMAKEDRIETIDIRMADNRLTAQLPSLEDDKRYQLILLGMTGTHTVPISNGENGGKTLAYHNPVEWVEHLGQWQGEQQIVSHEIKSNEKFKQWVILAQTWPIGEIVAAGVLAIP